MSLPPILLSAGEFCVMRAEIADKLLLCGDGDSILLYLYALRHSDHFDEKTATRALNFTTERYERAMFTLTGLEIATSAETPISPERSIPAYRPAELREARTADHRFSAVCHTAEGVLGKVLTDGFLRSLFTAYNHLGLPAEVIIELLTYLKREKTTIRRTDLDREATLWADMGLFTVQDAASYLERRDMEKPLLDAMRAQLGLTDDRPLSANETRYLLGFIAMGFPPDTVALAADRMQQSLGKFSWQYLRKILASWDAKGVHTVTEVTAIEPRRGAAAMGTSGASSTVAAAPTAPGKLENWEQQWLEDVASRRRQRGEEA